MAVSSSLRSELVSLRMSIPFSLSRIVGVGALEPAVAEGGGEGFGFGGRAGAIHEPPEDELHGEGGEEGASGQEARIGCALPQRGLEDHPFGCGESLVSHA